VLATAAWLVGRVAFAIEPVLPLPLTVLAELAYIPILIALIAPPILRERNRNMAMIGVLTLLWLTDAAFMFALYRGDPLLASKSLGVAINIVLLLITIIGGRIVPAFTANGLRQAGQTVTLRNYALVERALPIVMLAVIVVDAVVPGGTWAVAVAALAALLHAIRLSGWRSLRVTGKPILWVLHLAYVWLPIGFALKAVYLAAGSPWAQWWQHAFGIGVFALMILAVTTRASLGHTGRPLNVHPTIPIAYLLVALAALTRIAGPSIWPAHYLGVLTATATMWTTAFLIFVAIYGPILTRPRLDGKRG